MKAALNSEQGLAEILRWLRTAPRPTMIVFSGMTCSGKSTLARKLKELLGDEAEILPLDDFFREHTDPLLPIDGNGKMIFDLPESYDDDGFKESAKLLINGSSVTLTHYHKPTMQKIPDEGRRLEPKPVIIPEGLFAIEFLKHFNVAILFVFVKADPEICLSRRIDRDAEKHGVTPKIIRKFFEQRIMPYMDILMLQEEDADIVISTD